MALGLGLRCGPALGAVPRPKPLILKASDGVKLAALYRAPAKGRPVFVLLHGLGAGKEEWDVFAGLLAARGFGSLALDARGHGKSGGPSYETFRTPEDWTRIELDLEAALAALKSRAVPERRIVLAGASIGANLALRVAARHPQVPLALLLSPGVDYQGVGIEAALAALKSPLILAAAGDDVYAFRTAQWAQERRRVQGDRFLRAASGHGVKMLEGEANRPFAEELMRGVDAFFKPSPASSSGTRASP